MFLQRPERLVGGAESLWHLIQWDLVPTGRPNSPGRFTKARTMAPAKTKRSLCALNLSPAASRLADKCVDATAGRPAGFQLARAIRFAAARCCVYCDTVK